VRGQDIIVIGASAGGVEALSKLCSAFPTGFRGSIFVVLHTTAAGESRLPQILSRRGQLTAVHPEPDTEIKPGVIYVARPNRHLIIQDGKVSTTIGPRENGYRPSINALFESAAWGFGERVAGVILSGSLDDGTLGLLTIKQFGGAALVQSPEESLFTGMPASALERVDVDFCGTVSEIADWLIKHARTGTEVQTTGMTGSKIPNPDEFANPGHDASRKGAHATVVAGFTCPDCGGVLQESSTGDYLHYRCHVGHEVSEKSLLQFQAEQVETAIWVALRTLEERIELSNRVKERAQERGNHHVVNHFRRQNEEAERNAELLRRVLSGNGPEPSITTLQDVEPDLTEIIQKKNH
jgi:two-component system, chemotaxis family, protein-glutamate methylesterase/glutaminase